MPVFVQVCIEENWHGGCEESEFACNTSQRNQINTALNAVETITRSSNWGLSGLESLRTCLRNKIDTIEINCEGCSYDGYQSGNRITICDRSFSSYSQNRINAIVFHELVHSCGGTELDAEAFENHFFRFNGATAPTSDDFPKFRDDGGNFVNWNGTTGAVTVKGTGAALNVNNSSFVDPDPPDDDGWI